MKADVDDQTISDSHVTLARDNVTTAMVNGGSMTGKTRSGAMPLVAEPMDHRRVSAGG